MLATVHSLTGLSYIPTRKHTYPSEFSTFSRLMGAEALMQRAS